MTVELLDSYEDEYDGVVIVPECLPDSADDFMVLLRSSLAYWKSKGKKGIWLKVLEEQANLVPPALKKGFKYHHAEPGHVMLTYWIPDEPSMIPSTATHQIGIGAFVINENREVLVVKEKRCPLRCSGMWKLPTGFINKSEEIFSGAVREVKEETGWMPLDEFSDQPFHREDRMLKSSIDICTARYEDRYCGFAAHRMMSKFDDRLSYLYYGNIGETTGST